MNRWTRLAPFEPKAKNSETWIYNGKSTEKKHHVEVTFGKPIDILSLKLNMIEDYGASVSQVRDSRLSLFSGKNLERLPNCPICKDPSTNASKIIDIYGATYLQCTSCSHYYIQSRPSREALENFYSKDTGYQKTYADKRTTETRVQQVAMPKVKWALEQYQRLFNKKPKAILDVGAGSGHFVYACRQLGLKADGLELSDSGIAFCKNVFDIELQNLDFINDWDKIKNEYDLITFWGVIEHVTEPMMMLQAANKLLDGKDGLVIAEVPRWNCLGSSIQEEFPNSIVRHLDPLGHINCFTDSSLATALQQNNFEIVSAWYFGMDMYELVTQLAYNLDENKLIEELKRIIPSMQKDLDQARFSDEMVFAGRNIKL